MGDYAENNC